MLLNRLAMQINFNKNLTTYNRYPFAKPKRKSVSNRGGNVEYSTLPSQYGLVNFSNVSFRSQASRFLLKQTKDLKYCAYTKKLLLDPVEARAIYAKLEKAPNALSAINHLKNVEPYMLDVESEVFDLFTDAPKNGKLNFKTILEEYKPFCLKRLEEKQEKVLTDTDSSVSLLNATLKKRLNEIRELSLNGTLRRKSTLTAVKELIDELKSKGFQLYNPEELEIIEQIYKSWYKSPCSLKDFDAFVVKYSQREHEEIAKRLISTAEASADHIIPSFREGETEIGNMLLVSAGLNNPRQDSRLSEFFYLNDEIDFASNLQSYANRSIELTKDRRKDLSQFPNYPEDIAKNIYIETDNKIKLDINGLKKKK